RAHPELFHDSARRELGRHRTLGRRGRRTRATTDLRPLSEVRTPATTVGLDLEEILRSVGAITADLQLEEVIARVLDAALTNVGADHGLLALEQDGALTLVAVASARGESSIFTDPPLLGDAGEIAPTQLINFVFRTGKSVVLDDVRNDLRFASDPYLDRTAVRSALGLP